MSAYRFVSNWRVDAPISLVWEALADSERWPEWWKGVESVVEITRGDQSNGDGNVRRYAFKSLLPYTLVFEMRVTLLDPPFALEGIASGELEGTGRWRLTAMPEGGTAVRYLWDVRTRRRWMNLLGPLLHPIFVWNHDVIMRRGERGLRRHLASQARAS